MQQRDEVRSLHELVKQFLGVASRPLVAAAPTATAGAAAELLMPNNAARAAFVFVNLSVNAAYLMIDNGVLATRGIYVPPNGGNMVSWWMEDLEMVGYDWWIITPAGASEYLLMQFIIT